MGRARSYPFEVICVVVLSKQRVCSLTIVDHCTAATATTFCVQRNFDMTASDMFGRPWPIQYLKSARQSCLTSRRDASRLTPLHATFPGMGDWLLEAQPLSVSTHDQVTSINPTLKSANSKKALGLRSRCLSSHPGQRSWIWTITEALPAIHHRNKAQKRVRGMIVDPAYKTL